MLKTPEDQFARNVPMSKPMRTDELFALRRSDERPYHPRSYPNGSGSFDINAMGCEGVVVALPPVACKNRLQNVAPVLFRSIGNGRFWECVAALQLQDEGPLPATAQSDRGKILAMAAYSPVALAGQRRGVGRPGEVNRRKQGAVECTTIAAHVECATQ